MIFIIVIRPASFFPCTVSGVHICRSRGSRRRVLQRCQQRRLEEFALLGIILLADFACIMVLIEIGEGLKQRAVLSDFVHRS